jgi:putative protein kinase ArgK-like GTPase of G3E family
MRDITIRIKDDENNSREIQDLIQILTEDSKPDWRREVIGWRAGGRSQSERGIALMLEAIRRRNSEHQSSKIEKKDSFIQNHKHIKEQENPFG